MKTVLRIFATGFMAISLLMVSACAQPPAADDKADEKMEEKMEAKGDEKIEKAEVKTNNVTIVDFAFGPDTLTIKKGTTVTWVNNDTAKHTVTGDDGGPDSTLLAKGDTYSYTFNEVGTFAYHCTPHPFMKAKVVVTQ